MYLLGLTVGERELYFLAHERAANTYNSSALVAAGACYLIMTIPLTYLVNAWDRRLRAGKTRRRRGDGPIGPVAPTPNRELLEA